MDSRTESPHLRYVSVIAVRYRNETLELYFRLFRGAVAPEFIFMNNNAHPHRADIIDDFLETEDIQRMLLCSLILIL